MGHLAHTYAYYSARCVRSKSLLSEFLKELHCDLQIIPLTRIAELVLQIAETNVQVTSQNVIVLIL